MFDFGLLFKEIDDRSLFNVWPTIKHKPRELYQIRLDENVVESTNDEDILDFLHLLKFIPARRVLLLNAMKQFLVFSKVFIEIFKYSKVDFRNIMLVGNVRPYFSLVFFLNQKDIF